MNIPISLPFKTTMVSMFFNLKKLKDQTISTRPLEFYIQNCVHVLSLKYPLVLFCDEDTVDMLREIRNKEVSEDIPTTYIVKDLSEYEYYKNNWPIIHDNRQKYNADIYVNSRNTSSYFLMGMFKPLALLLAKQVYDSEYYAWIDVGCNHVVRNLTEYAPKMLDNPNPKISACYIHYRKTEELENMRQYMQKGGPCGIATTAFTVEKKYIEQYYVIMFSIFYEMLGNGIGHTDETVMTYMANRCPELFTFYNGDYYSIFTNYHDPREDITTIYLHFIKNADKKHASEATIRLLNSSNKNLIQLGKNDIELLEKHV
jgi:hypothetical protein